MRAGVPLADRVDRSSGCLPKAKDPFVVAFKAAKAEHALTIAQISALTPVAKGTIRHWLSDPGRGIWTEDLRAVATVLEAPELLDLRETKARRVTLTCLDCGAIRVSRPGMLRGEIEKVRAAARKHSADGNVDWVAGTGEFRCNPREPAHANPQRAPWQGHYGGELD